MTSVMTLTKLQQKSNLLVKPYFHDIHDWRFIL